jgi:hypothetical protein
MLILLIACGSPRATTPPDGTVDPPIDGAVDASPPDAAPSGDPFEALRAMSGICSPDQWCWRAPAPSGNLYSHVYSTAPDNIWLIGQHGTVMQWNGHAWTAHHPPVPAGYDPIQLPMSITGRSRTDTWLIYGTSVVHWDGVKWTLVDTAPAGAPITYDSIWEAPNGDVWFTTSIGTVKRSVGGGPFQELAVNACPGCFLGSIWGTSADDIFITTLPAGIVHYDGQSFTRSYNGPAIAGSYLGTKNDVWVSGADGALLHWDGTSWTPMDTGVGAYVAGVAALAGNDVWWWASSSSAAARLLHWDGATLTAARTDTAGAPLLYAGAIIAGRWWLVGDAGGVYTLAGATVSPVVEPTPLRSARAIWGTAENNLYFATGGEIVHWDGTSLTSIPIAASTLSGIHKQGTDELFATGFELSADRTEYLTMGYHFNGTSWTSAQLERAPIEAHRYFAQTVALASGEALSVGYGGLAYRYASGQWTPIATGITTDLVGVWGPDADSAWMTGPRGVLLRWSRVDPGIATPDLTLPPTSDDLGPIHGAAGITWIGVTNNTYVFSRSAAGAWTTVPASVVASGIFAVSATNVVASSAAQSRLARWNGTQFVAEDTASGIATPVLFQPPGGLMLAAGRWGILQHP